jgi:GntR family transcriptional repressor for pyruvate dehydrogenase complex
MVEQGVSRSVVREAISRMQAAGLVETRHGIGTFVLPPPPAAIMGIDPATVMTVRDVIALLELRIGLETEAAGLAAARRTEAQLAEVRAALAALQQARAAARTPSSWTSASTWRSPRRPATSISTPSCSTWARTSSRVRASIRRG